MSKLLKSFQCNLNGEKIDIPIYHSSSPQRKKMCLSYHPNQLKAFVKTPQRISKKTMIEFLQKHLLWLKGQVFKFGVQCRPQKFEDGTSFLFKGKAIKLEHHESFKKKIYFSCDAICTIECPKDLVDRYMRKWMVEQTRLFATERSVLYAEKIQKKISAIRIKDVKTRWGSCSTLGNLNYNWRLIMVPEAVFDYVCAHEVSHLMHMNHSKEFWDQVKKFVSKETIKYSKNWLEIHKKQIYQWG